MLLQRKIQLLEMKACLNPKTIMFTANFPEKLGLNLSEEKSFTKHLIP